MGLDDKISNKKEDLEGKAKEAVGKTTGDDELEAEGATFEGGDPGRAEKGAAWVLELPRGRPAQARYMAPPQL